jgi:5-methylcytosine-specific restriction endonuclease McrA
MTSNGRCVDCLKEYKKLPKYKLKSAQTQKIYKEENKIEIKTKMAEWYARTREARVLACRAWYSANKKIRLKKVMANRADNPESFRARQALNHAANPEKRRSAWRNYRAMKIGSTNQHTAQDIKDLYAAQKGRCAYCKVKVGHDYHVDHIQPISKGGSNGKKNLQICCPSCNLRKHAKDPIDFAQEVGFLI